MSLTNSDILLAMKDNDVDLIVSQLHAGNSINNRFSYKRGVHTNNYDFYEYAFYTDCVFFEEVLNRVNVETLRLLVDLFSDSFIVSIFTSKISLNCRNRLFALLNKTRKNRLSNALLNIMRCNSLVKADYTSYLNTGDGVEVALWSDDLNALMDIVRDDEDFFSNSDKNYWKLAAIDYRAVKCFDFISNNLRVA